MTTLPDLDTARRWRNLPLVATDGAAVGLIEGIYVDGETGRPEWALVGLDADGASRSTFVPLVGAGEDDGKVHVPCERERITGAPPLPASGTLSRMEETRLYDHYGIAYSTAASPSVLPAAETDPSDLDHPMADDELDGVGSALDTQPGAGTTGVRAAFASEPLVAQGHEPVEVPPARGRGRLASRALVLAGLATAGGLAAVRRRRRGSRSGVRAEVTRQMSRSKRKAARAGRRAGQAPAQLAEAGTRVARAAAKTAEAAARQAARTADKTSRRAARTAEKTRRKAARAAADAGRRAARTAEDARRRAADVTDAAADAVGTAARTAGTVAGLPAAGATAARKRLGEATPRRGKSKKKQKKQKQRNAPGRFGLALGGAVGYLLGTRAGRERYDQMVAAAKQLGERPEVKRIVEQAPGAIDATVGQAAGKAADRLGQARERMVPDKPAASPGEGGGTGA
jgi:hypothetical protein